MAPSASIIVPTQSRAGYLDVALASIAPQAARAGAEVLVVDDAWGANMAVRRGAMGRVGRFGGARELYGDEQEWQARWKATGGRIRYVAAAALDHRRAGDDARLRSLARAAYARGAASRR